MKNALLLSLVLLFTCVFACTKKEEAPSGQNAAATNNAAKGETNIQLGTVGETMAFDKTDLTVPAGQKITLTLTNNSTTLQHNWVLTQPGKDNDVGMEGIKAGPSKGFIPDDPAIIAHTKLVDPKKGGTAQTDTVTFTAPPPGDYPYECTNAGHHTVMKGVLHSVK